MELHSFPFLIVLPNTNMLFSNGSAAVGVGSLMENIVHGEHDTTNAIPFGGCAKSSLLFFIHIPNILNKTVVPRDMTTNGPPRLLWSMVHITMMKSNDS